MGGPAEPARCVSDRTTRATRAQCGADQEVEAEPDEEDEGAQAAHDKDFAGGREACGHAGESSRAGVLIQGGSECIYADRPRATISAGLSRENSVADNLDPIAERVSIAILMRSSMTGCPRPKAPPR